jgi:serine/threonine protein kinase
MGRAGAERFECEGRLLARLQHPNIARLLDAGIDRDQPYLVLEYVDGETIDCWCDARQVGLTDRIRLFLDVLAAVAHAHGRLRSGRHATGSRAAQPGHHPVPDW